MEIKLTKAQEQELHENILYIEEFNKKIYIPEDSKFETINVLIDLRNDFKALQEELQEFLIDCGLEDGN